MSEDKLRCSNSSGRLEGKDRKMKRKIRRREDENESNEDDNEVKGKMVSNRNERVVRKRSAGEE